MTEPLQILSLGAGVQSSTLALMASAGDIGPMPTCAIFADTGDEPSAVYEHLAWLEAVLPFPTIRVSAGDLMADNLKIVRSQKSGKLYMGGHIPAFVLKADGKVGLLGRKCTSEYKIEPIHRAVRGMLGKQQLNAWRKKHRQSASEFNHAVEQKRQCDSGAWNEMQDDALAVMWIGISSDEWLRAKPSRQPWLRSRWPLLETRTTRQDCLQWLLKNGHPIAPRSACKKCPFHGDEEWAAQSPEEFAESVQYEKDMQEAARNQEALRGVPYLHESCQPLDSIDFHRLLHAGKAQLDLFANECEGMCGV
jgi:hypothetical protein